jgi:hypothetical protein
MRGGWGAAAALIVALLSVGCLEGNAPEPGRRILAGRDLRRPVLSRSGGKLHVLYETQKPPDDPTRAAPRLWAVPYEGGEPHKLADNGAWPVTVEPGGTALVVHDLAPASGDAVVRWYPRVPAALTRVDLATGAALKEFDYVLDFGFWSGRLFLEAFAFGEPLRQLRVEQADGRMEDLVPAADVQWSRRGEAFLLAPGPNSPRATELLRMRRPGDQPEMLQERVSRFMLHPSEELVVSLVQPPLPARAEVWVSDLVRGRGDKVALDPSWQWLDFVPNSRELVCLGRAAARSPDDPLPPSLIHLVDLQSGVDRSVELAPGDPGTVTLEWAPGEEPAALLHASDRAWLLRVDGEPRVQSLGERALRAEFSPDGRHVVYIDFPSAGAGRFEDQLVIQDTALREPPRVLTPPYAYVQSFVFAQGGRSLAYTTHFGDFKGELHLVDLDGGQGRLLARGVGWWLWPWGDRALVVEPQVVSAGGRLLVVRDWSFQDRVGELVLFDLDAHSETVLAYTVLDFSVEAACSKCGLLDPGAQVALVSLERSSSPNDGLWALTLP